MIIRDIILQDFRQFKGRQSITFAGPVSDSRKNVTVIFGENGRGKTGLYRAVLFGLFGETSLPQDDDISNKAIRLVNADLVRESPEREAIEASVELTFDHNGQQYNILRKLYAAKSGGKVEEETGTAELRILQSDGNTLNIVNDQNIKERISSILDPRVKEYYLFDGERMDRLTRAGVNQRREVARGIRSLLNIDALENASKAMERVTSGFTSDLNKTSSTAYVQVLQQIEKCQNDMKGHRDRIVEIEAEIAIGDEEILKIDRELEAYQEIKDDVQRRNALTQERDKRIRDRDITRTNLSNVVGRSGILIVKPVLSHIYKLIDSVRSSGELPAEVRRELIERVIQDDRCICGREVANDVKALASVREWLERTTEEAIEDSALLLWRQLSGITSHVDDYEREIEGHLQLYGSANSDIIGYERELEEITLKIGASERKDAGSLESLRSNANKKRLDLMTDCKLHNQQLHENRTLLVQLNAKKAEEEAKKAQKDEYSLRVDLSRKVTNALESVSSQFTTAIRERLSILATNALGVLLDSAGKANICKVHINDDYSIEVFNRFGDPWLAQISAGQRQVLSIAFVAALAEAASNGHLLEMPLFMDTPFGRLGAEHRENLMNLVPDKAAQWILLATDTEFRADEAGMLDATGRWGKLYFLEQDSSGNTLIREREATARSFHSYIMDRKKV